MSGSRTVVMVEGALCIALSVVLSYLKLFRMPQGGSLTLELVPLIVFAYRRGIKWGCGAGALAGVLHIMLGGYVVHPVQAVLDYPVAYAAMGLAGLWRNSKITSLTLAGLAQLLCHVCAGAIFFAAYAPAGTNPWVYSIGYNGLFLGPKLAFSAFATWVLWKNLERIYPSVK